MTTPLIESELDSTGVAQVIVILKTPGAATSLASAAGDKKRISAHFRSSEMSMNSQIAEAGVKKAGGFLASAAAAKSVKAPPPVRYYPNLGIALGTVDRAGLAALEKDPDVATVTGAPPISPIWPEHVAAAKAPKDLTWGLKALRVEALWNAGYTGKGVRVGHLDTGFDGNHPMAKGAVLKFAEFDLFGDLKSPAPKAYDTDDHGTHSGITIAGRAAGNRHAGVAPEARLLSAIVIEGGNALARVLGGIDWALGEGMQVLSMSLGFRGWWDNFVPIMAVLRARNVLPVIAVGNEGPGTSRSPGNYPNVLSVGAMDENGRVANFSSSQSFARQQRPNVPYLVAPGVDIISAKPGGGYQSMDGTSMATPHVAGLAALLYQANPNASVAEVENAILGSCTLRPGMRPSRAGAGCPDAVKALKLLTGVDVTAKPKVKPKTKKKSKKAKSKAKAKAKKAGAPRPTKSARSAARPGRKAKGRKKRA